MTSATGGGVIAANLSRVRERIARAAQRAGRDPATVTLVGVSKTFAAEAVIAAARAGLADAGENRVQEGVQKRAQVEAAGVRLRWHLIGRLQTNKVKSALAGFDILHGVDSLRLAETVNRHAVQPVDVLLEVNVAGETSKAGFAVAEVAGAVAAVAQMEHLRLRGLMTVAPAVTDPETVRPVFRRLRELRDAAGLTELSMGMSGDFEVAIEEGATLVRVGRAIFGERTAPTPSK